MPDFVTILVADDDAQVRRLVRGVLEHRGYAVIEAQNGEEALERALLERPDLLVLDANMPVLDGFAVCQQIRRNPDTEHIPIVMLTGEAATIDKAIEGLRAGADEYVYKPFDNETLLEVIQNTLPEAVLARSAKVLIVDDSSVNLQVMQGYLHGTGYRVDTATNGHDAVVQAQQDPPDVILLDVQMPGMGGFEVCAALKKDARTQGIPVMFVTANALSDDEMLRGYDNGAVDYLRKPFLRDELLARLQVMVRLKKQQAELERQAYLDPLTQLPNRRQLAARLEEEFARARRHETPLTVLLLDIDHFKQVNDNHGHEAGDAVLAALGRLLAQTARKEDVVARYGGEEFALVLPETPLDNALVVAQRVRRGVAALRVDYQGAVLEITASLGAAAFPDLCVENPRELLRYADEALYRAKSDGRNQVQAFRPSDLKVL